MSYIFYIWITIQQIYTPYKYKKHLIFDLLIWITKVADTSTLQLLIFIS